MLDIEKHSYRHEKVIEVKLGRKKKGKEDAVCIKLILMLCYGVHYVFVFVKDQSFSNVLESQKSKDLDIKVGPRCVFICLWSHAIWTHSVLTSAKQS